MPDKKSDSTVAVKVTFPISHRGPYQAEVDRDTLVRAVRLEAMTHFDAQEDTQFSYVLAHDGTEQADDKTLAEIASHSRAIKFTLIKKISQG